jgi:ribosomal protein L7Ae-like RNA K-turn-binding protein
MKEMKFCEPIKSLNGLKQALKQSHGRFNKVMLSNKFKTNEVDKYYVKNTNKYYIIKYLFVDDMLILGNNKQMIKSIKKMSTSEFNMKILGVVDVTKKIKYLEHIMD